MTGPTGQCASVADIERLAGGEAVEAAVSAHIDACPACRERVDDARSEARFLTRLRALGPDAMGPDGSPRIPGYRVLALVSTGAQGAVFRAVQEATSRTVAIKVLAPGAAGSGRRRARAEREAEIAARLRHPNVVTIYESRVLPDGRPCVVMEFVDGVPLDAWTPPSDSPDQRQRALLRAFISVCAGIHHAHLNGVIHRDLKPANILVTADARPVVLDFGIAKIGSLHATLTGEFAGTPAYASPEQVAGRPDDVDALTDIYSLGVILYRLLTGVMPYEVEGSIFEIARTIEHTEPVPPRRHEPSIHPDLEAVVLCAIRKDKARRYQSAAALATDLERFLAGQAVEARAGSGWYLLRKAVAVNRRRLALAGAGALTLLVAAVAVAISVGAARDAAHREALQRESAHLESVRARAVTELLRESLPVENPYARRPGGMFNPHLGRLYLRLESGAFANDPDLDQAVRRLWGSVYTTFGSSKSAGQVEYAEVSLRNGLVRLRVAHPGPHPDTASTMHELAGVLLLRRRAREAERECTGAIAMREALFGPDSIPVAESRALLARVLIELERFPDALAEADAAIAVLRGQSDDPSNAPLVSAVASKAHASLALGATEQAEPLVSEALTARLRSHSPDEPDLHASLLDAADFAARAPNSPIGAALARAWGCAPADAGAAIRRDIVLLRTPDRSHEVPFMRTGRSDAVGRLVRLQQALLAPDDPAIVANLVSQMRAAVADHDWDQHADAALRAADLLGARFGPNDFSVLLCLEQAGNMLMYSNRAERAVECNRRACAIWDAIPEQARDALLASNFRRRLALSLIIAGRFEEALVENQRALDGFRAVVDDDHHIIALTTAQHAYALLNTGRTAEADDLSARALDSITKSPSAAHDQIAHVTFIRAHTLCSLGRHAEARALMPPVWTAVYRFADTEFAWRRQFIADYADTLDAAGEHERAELWRTGVNTGADDFTLPID